MPDFTAFTLFDGIIIAIVLVSAVFGYRRGFMTEVLSLAAWAGAVLVTIFGLRGATSVFREFVEPDWVADVIAVLVLLIGSLVLLRLAASWIGDHVRTSFVGPLDRAAGTLFGMARGALIVVFGYMLFGYWVPAGEQPRSVARAQLRPLMDYSVEMLIALGPGLVEDARENRATEAILEEMRKNMPSSTFDDQDDDG